jgi:putative transposase
MIVTATLEDKSLQNSVNIFAEIHNKNILNIQKSIIQSVEKERGKDKKLLRTRGRPKSYKPKVAKSKLKDISRNTSSYTTARQRLDKDLVAMVYEESANFENINISNKWKGMDVLITDGTYIQMQDSKELREIYDVKSESGEYKSGYPQGLLQVVIEQGSGAIKHFELGNRHKSELELITRILPKIQKDTLLLADDLYSSYAIFCLIKQYNLEIIVPGKRKRNFKLVKRLAEGDEIVEIKMKEHPNWLSKEEKLPRSIQMRRLTFEDPLNPGKEYVLYTTLIDKKISKTDIVSKFFTRWDIEISIREIKTLMNINVVRSKKPDMVMKELMTTFIAYNLIRKIIASTTENSGFSPQGNIIQEYLEAGKTIHMDKKGRIYNRWSPGRYAGFAGKNQTAYNSEETG